MSRGRFITLEGGEGAGKSTQARRLAEALEARGVSAVLTREPGGADGAELIRSLLVEGDPERWDGLTEVLLHLAARRCHLRETIEPALQAGVWVVCDRFSDSTVAYQGYGSGVDRPLIETLSRAVIGGFVPDLTLVLDVPAEVGLARASVGKDTRYERMGRAYHARVRQGFLEIAKEAPERCVVVDAGGDADSVATEIHRIVFDRLTS